MADMEWKHDAVTKTAYLKMGEIDGIVPNGAVMPLGEPLRQPGGKSDHPNGWDEKSVQPCLLGLNEILTCDNCMDCLFCPPLNSRSESMNMKEQSRR